MIPPQLLATALAISTPPGPPWCSSLAQIASIAEQARTARATLDQVLAGLQTLPPDARLTSAGMIRAIYTAAPIPPSNAGLAALHECEKQNHDHD